MSGKKENSEENPVNKGNSSKRKVFAVSFKNEKEANRLYKYVEYRVNKGLSKDRGQALTDLLDAVQSTPLIYFNSK